MKRPFLFALLFALVTTSGYGQVDIDIKDSRDTVQVGNSARFTISLNVKNFTASIYLRASSPGVSDSSFSFGTENRRNTITLNPPYPQTVELRVTPAFRDTGVKQIIVFAENGTVFDQDTCEIRVSWKENWRIFPVLHAPGNLLIGRDSSVIFTTQDKDRIIGRITPDGVSYQKGWNNLVMNGGIEPRHVHIRQDSAGNLWLTTGSALNDFGKYDGKFWSSYSYTPSDPKYKAIDNITIDSANNIWLLSGMFNASGNSYNISQCITKFDGKNFTSYDVEYFKSRFSQNYYAFHNLVIAHDTIWLKIVRWPTPPETGYIPEMFMFDGSDWSKSTMSPVDMIQLNRSTRSAEPGIYAVRSFTENNITGYRLSRLAGSTWQDLLDMPSEYKGYASQIVHDKNGFYWILDNRALYRYDGNDWEILKEGFLSRLPSTGLGNIATDDFGNIWMSFSGQSDGGNGRCIAVFNPLGLKGAVIGLPVAVEEAYPFSAMEIFSYPNPAGASAKISFMLKESSAVTLKIVDLSGNSVFERKLGNRGPGPQEEVIPTGHIPSGNYYIRIETGGSGVTRKIAIMH